MGFPIFIRFGYQSRYSLLGAMATEIAEAFAEKGCAVNPPGIQPGAAGSPGCAVLWLNFLSSVTDLHKELTRPGSRAALLQFFVDHPLALWPEQMDVLSRLDNFRMCLPCADGTHLLRLRWPRLKHAHCLHGVPRSALAPAEAIEASHAGAHGTRAPGTSGPPGTRAVPLLVMGSIHTMDEIGALRAKIPARLHRGCDDAAELLVAHPWMSFEQAMEVTLGVERTIVGEWALLALTWRYVTAAVNRRRRVALVRAMEGVETVVHGADAWREFCRGGAGAPERSTIEHRGDLRYEDVPGALRGARACLAWGPTQFTHSFSERLLLSLASGCATIADDRLLVRRHFVCEPFGAAPAEPGAQGDSNGVPSAHDASVLNGARSASDGRAGRTPCVGLFDASRPESAREAVEAALADPGRCAAMGRAGRDAVEQGHLWAHRVETIAAIGGESIAA